VAAELKTVPNPNPLLLPIQKGGRPFYLDPPNPEFEEFQAAAVKAVYADHKRQALADGSPTVPYSEPAGEGQPSYWLR
jgi:hypothetical protein